jgi:methyl-accepting chemotaxis protein
MHASDAWRYALAAFLVLTGLGLGYVFLRLAGTLQRVNAMLDGLVAELVPMLSKVSTSIDHVNSELDKVGNITDSAVDATEKIDHTVRAVSDLISKPVKAASGMSAGIKHGFETFRAKRGQRGGVV